MLASRAFYPYESNKNYCSSASSYYASPPASAAHPPRQSVVGRRDAHMSYVSTVRYSEPALRLNVNSTSHEDPVTPVNNHQRLSASSSTGTAIAAPMYAMPPKRPSSGSPTETPAKLQKTEQKSEDFSSSVKKRLQGSSRTGQACDRCKIRKIRCDGLPGGCSPCLQNQTECRTTDRITGRAAPRGYVEGLENQNTQLQNKVAELERLLLQTGVDYKPSSGFHDSNGNMSNGASYTFQSSNAAAPAWQNPTSSYSTASSTTSRDGHAIRSQPILKTGFSGDHFLGVSTGYSHLSSIKGTALSILGMEIDIADFSSEDVDEPDPSMFHAQLYNKSHQAFIQSTLNVNQRIEKLDLPPREEGLTYAEWYFRVINPYLPILHKPTFMKLITRMYDDHSFHPTAAQTVMVHMVFAIMFFQYSTRNWEDAAQQATLNNRSNLHYHHALGMFYQLSISHTVEDCQALGLICIHLRNFPKPGPSWTLSATVLGLAIELGLHRSVKSRPDTERPLNPLEVEMRKRIFWCILGVHTTVSGKLGRPIHLRMDDIDVELPEEIDDELLSEAGIDTSRPGKCTHRIGLAALGLLPVFMEMYATIYAVRRSPDTYVESVNQLEARLQNWISTTPDDLLNGTGNIDTQEDRVFSLYTQVWICEVRMLLYHPSTSLSTDASFNAKSMDICLASARKMLEAVVELQKFRSLDTTWYQSAVYVMAITTTLFAQWEKREQTTLNDLAELRKEMDVWLDVMGDVGKLLGSGTRLREAVRNVTYSTLALLSQNVSSKPGYAIPQQAASGTDVAIKMSPQRAASVSVGSMSAHTATNGFAAPSYNGTSPTQRSNSVATTYVAPENSAAHQQTPYPAATQYPAYSNGTPSNASNISYTPSPAHHHSSFSYPATNNESVEAPLLTAFANQASQVAAQDWQRPQSQQLSNSGLMSNHGSQSWQQWTSTVANNLEPQDCYSASALMQLGGRDIDNGPTQVGAAHGAVTTAPMSTITEAHAAAMAVAHMHSQDAHAHTLAAAAHGITWPLNVFDIPPQHVQH